MPTDLPVPSSDVSDLRFNAEKIDEMVNSAAPSYLDRLGVARLTLAGAVALAADEASDASASATAAAGSAAAASGSATSAGGSATAAAASAAAAAASALSASTLGGIATNLKVSATGLNANVTVSADGITLRSSTNTYETIYGLNLTSSTAAILDTGALATNTWYYLYVATDGTTPILRASLNSTTPGLPAGYNEFAGVGAFRTDGTGNKYPLGFTKAGKRTTLKVASGSNVTTPAVMASATSATFLTAVAVAAFIPPSATAIDVGINCNNLALGGAVVAAPNSSYAASSPYDAPLLMGNGNSNGIALSLRTLMAVESANIYWGASTGTATPANLVCYGWEDSV